MMVGVHLTFYATVAERLEGVYKTVDTYGEAMYYILDQKNNPTYVTDFKVWMHWHEKNEERCQVAFDRIGELWISTRFFGKKIAGISCLFETIVFDRDHRPLGDDYRDLYETYGEALSGHKRFVELCRKRGGER